MTRFITAILVALLGSASTAVAQAHGPTVTAARVAFVAPSSGERRVPVVDYAATSCGSASKNAALLGLGLSLATATLELAYTVVREPFVRNGHDVPGADPTLIGWAGGAGFIGGLVATTMCRRRR
ncbi:MAG TPA: hypothetical protein VJ650_13380 [Gemmatimonadaceae bacterium]|nr:hypothetical protein [Gemmatimonadaceae bacterium]